MTILTLTEIKELSRRPWGALVNPDDGLCFIPDDCCFDVEKKGSYLPLSCLTWGNCQSTDT